VEKKKRGEQVGRKEEKKQKGKQKVGRNRSTTSTTSIYPPSQYSLSFIKVLDLLSRRTHSFSRLIAR
jgi:hypothetical protein